MNNTLQQLTQQLRKKEISSVELTQFYLQQIERLNPHHNAFITVTPEKALAQAEQADKARKTNTDLPALWGVPIAYKDIFCTQDVRTTCGSKMLENFISPYNAHVVERLTQNAGMPMLGKVNMDAFAMGSSNEHSYFGTPKNPHNDRYVCGGSSGGSACAVAAHMAPISVGTDTGGSVRQPAAFCGLTAIKPTYGSVSRFGMIAFASSLDQAGPIAQNAWDAGLLLEAMVHQDTRDSTCIKHPDSIFTPHQPNKLKGLKVGVPVQLLEYIEEPAIKDAFNAFLAWYKTQGATLVDIELPHAKYALPAYYVIAPAECSSNLSRFDGVRFGHRCKDPVNLNDLYSRSRAEGFGEEVKRRILLGTHVLSSESYDAYYVKAQKIRRLVIEDFKNAFQNVDTIATPTTPGSAFKIGANMDNVLNMYQCDIFTVMASLAGLPAICTPCGTHNNLPLSAQLVGPHFDDKNLINYIHQYQQDNRCHTTHANR